MEDKYIELLLKKCLDVEKSKYLYVSYDVINQDFIYGLIKKAKELGVEEIFLEKNDIYYEKNVLNNIGIEDIENHPCFDRSMRNIYADKETSFLIFRAPVPGVMDDIEPEKIAKAEYVKRKTSSYFIEKQLSHKVPWCIAALPNKVWANKVFDNVDNALELLEDTLYKVCMVDTKNPIESWNSQLERNKLMLDKLNGLKLKLLHYKNKIGTDLTIEMLDDGVWCDASNRGLSNMPSYEIFTTPDYRKTNGIVYNSRPLVYNGGVIDNFWLKFEGGRVVDFEAEVGEEILRGIISSDENSSYLGECAIVENDSPISKTSLIYGLTLIDENASCHLALGKGFVECSSKAHDLAGKDLLDLGINQSRIHVDFMIGTDDLEIVGETVDGKKIKILEAGNFSNKF